MLTDSEQQYGEAEAAAEAARRAKAKRQPVILIALVNALVVGVGLTATVDLRRLHTPWWHGAAVDAGRGVRRRPAARAAGRPLAGAA